MIKLDQIAIISDIHGNLPALEAVLEDIKDKGISQIICLGDMIGKGPHSMEVLEQCLDHCHVIIKGIGKNLFPILKQKKRTLLILS